jgi:hypothetical protein
MNRVELLSLSEKIAVDGSSLRQIYESRLIGERGLRRLVAEYTQGGDLKKALRREIVEREIDFERDPAMRDLAVQDAAAGGGGGNGGGRNGSGAAALNTLLAKAAVNVTDGTEEAAFFKARAAYEATYQEQHQKHRRAIDISMAGAIVVLVAAVIFLFVSRG